MAIIITILAIIWCAVGIASLIYDYTDTQDLKFDVVFFQLLILGCLIGVIGFFVFVLPDLIVNFIKKTTGKREIVMIKKRK